MTIHNINRVWTEARLKRLEDGTKSGKSNASIAAEIGVQLKQVQRRRELTERKKAEQGNTRPEPIDYSKITISKIEQAAIKLGAKEINGSYYLDGKRILVGAMIQKANCICL